MRRVVIALGAMALAACAAEPASAPADAASAGAKDLGEAAPTGDATLPAPTTPAAVHARHAGLRDAVIAYLAEPNRIVAGDWVGDYGDAPFYGPGFDLRWWQATGTAYHETRALEALAWDRTQVLAAVDDLSQLLTDMEPLAMSLLGLLEAAELLGDPSYLEPADALLEVVDTVSEGLGDYLEIEAGQFAANTYGPTAITGFVALVHLQRARTASGEARTVHLERAAQVLAAIDAKAWDATLGAYRVAPEDPQLEIYPNIIVMIACGRFYELTGDPSWVAKAETIHAGIAPLKVGAHYRSPYSAAYMGATDPDYATLSSQNYLMLALLLLFRGTGDLAYLEELDGVLGWLEGNLLAGGQILHHWMDGARATPAHKEYYCSGCNLQTLYVLSLLLE